jgi:glycosyltransferase involved in cell wall biosynthesis
LERELRALEVRSALLSTDADGPADRLKVPTGYPIQWSGAIVHFDRVHAPKRFRMSFGHARTIWRNSRDADAIHVHGLYLCSSVAAWASARHRRIPIIVQPHGVLEPYHRQKSRAVKAAFDSLIGRRILNDSAAIVCASGQEAANIQALGHAQTVVIEHGVDLEDGEPSPATRQVVESIGASQMVLFLGRFAKKKNPDVLIRAWSLARPPDAVLVLSGPDDYWSAEALRELAVKFGVTDSVIVTPPAYGSDKTALLMRADLFALPSDNESFGITIPEAMAASTACLVSVGVATSSTVQAASAGYVVTDLDPQHWADQIAAALGSRERLREMGTNAGRLGSSRFSWKTSAAAYADLYTTCIQR